MGEPPLPRETRFPSVFICVHLWRTLFGIFFACGFAVVPNGAADYNAFMPTWDSSQYLQFASERTRPCRDLAGRVELDAPARVMDLGCGPGNSTKVLAERWPGARIVGIDSSAAMIKTARRDFPGREWVVGDIAAWAYETGGESFDRIFSNAAMQWVSDHATTYPRIFGRVAPGGALAT
ncbi:MAG: Trans-aconitate 2-methyltransferase, partial [Phycisphaerales bacterium]|nr:Trans-aconitate 2-methyltransferase [Phycisphaerales bacterium]